ncbi:hypothetical protein PAMP_005747 [Pampus punctatissimus]
MVAVVRLQRVSAARLQGQGTGDYGCSPFECDKYDVTFFSFPPAHSSFPLWCLPVIPRHTTSPTPLLPPNS